MLTMRDGPAKGTYMCKRAPQYVRVTRSMRDGRFDVLDQLSDTPLPYEEIFVYRIATWGGTVHINRGSRGSGFYPMATYQHIPDVDGEAVRDTAAWREWALAQPALMIDQPTD